MEVTYSLERWQLPAKNKNSHYYRLWVLKTHINWITVTYFFRIWQLMTIMSMGWDYVSELRTSTCLLLIIQVIDGYGETRWNDINRINSFVQRSSLEIYEQSHLVVIWWNGEGNDEFCLQKYLIRTSKGSLTFRKILRLGGNDFNPPPQGRILQPLKIHRPRPCLNVRTLGKGKKTQTTRPMRTTYLTVTELVNSSYVSYEIRIFLSVKKDLQMHPLQKYSVQFVPFQPTYLRYTSMFILSAHLHTELR
jgi:hypothetical protein